MYELNSFKNEDYVIGSDLCNAICDGEIIFVKNISFEEKVEFLRKCFNDPSLTNAGLLLNINLLTLGGNLEDSIFNRDEIIFSSLMEFLDIKYELRSEIKELEKNLLKCFLGVIKGLGTQLEEKKVDIDNIYWHLLHVVTFQKLGKIMNEISIEINDISPVKNSDYLLSQLCQRNELTSTFLKMFLSEETEN